MKKISLMIGMSASIFALAQQSRIIDPNKGRVGINTTKPFATLDVTGKPSDENVIDGIIAPRLTRKQLLEKKLTYQQTMASERPSTGAIVYVTDVSELNALKNQELAFYPGEIEIPSVGYYYWSGSQFEPLEKEHAIVTIRNKYGVVGMDGIGLSYRKENPNNYGNIGRGAIDFSYSNSNELTYGALGTYSFAQGSRILAGGNYSFAQGSQSIARGDYSFAQGFNVQAQSYGETARGFFNLSPRPYETSYFDKRDLIESVGAGDYNQRLNLFERYKSGAFKFIAQELNNTNIPEAKKGFHAADEDGKLNYYNGNAWQTYISVIFAESEPSTPKTGDMYFNTQTKKYFAFDGSQWNALW